MGFADNLPAFNAASLPSFFGGDNAAAACTNAAAGLSEDYRLSRRIKKRTMLDATKVPNAARHLQRLPERDEDVHIVFRGNFDAFDLTPAILELAQVNADELLIATLGFNEKGTARLLDLIDTGRVRSVWFLSSVYFQASCRSSFDYLAEGLTARGQRVAARRNHAKVQALKLADGRHIVCEGSANLRSCRNVEQAVITESLALYNFHRSWMAELFEGASK
ncbi:MAG: hypothetical protein AMXMBFR13_22460 [Phycisphaerae bacterium]